MNNRSDRDSVREGILLAMKALDNRIARAMQRDAAQRSELGVQKWQPLNEKVELVTVMLLDALNDQEVQLDSLLVLAQALSKALNLIIQDLGEPGLGKIRSSYCLNALQNISADTERALSVLKEDRLIS